MNRIVFLSAIAWFCCDTAFGEEPLQVYLMIGQSNMQGHAHVRTLEHVGMDPATRPMLEEILEADGSPRKQDRVWISYLTNSGVKSGPLTVGFGANEEKIGPELTFGIYIQKRLSEPVLLIKAAWGGKSLHTDFRPPSAGVYEFSRAELEQLQNRDQDVAVAKAARAEASGVYYRLTVEHIRKVLANIQAVYPEYEASQGYELAGCVWFQGWNDMVDRSVYPERELPDGYAAYSDLLASFIRDLRRDLSAPQLSFVIGVMGVGGPVSRYTSDQQRYAAVHQNFRDAMAAPAGLPEFKDNVAIVLTENYWDAELSDLRSRETAMKRKLQQRAKQEGWSTAETKAAEKEKYTEEFSQRELKVLESGISNAEYHYLGSAKIMAQIGKAFAEAMLDLNSDH